MQGPGASFWIGKRLDGLPRGSYYMFAPTLRRSIIRANMATSAPFSNAVVRAMKKLCVLQRHWSAFVILFTDGKQLPASSGRQFLG
jgi:hypothetical protein